MKFARYLEDNQTPEWKRAYIDYRGLKKRISAIRKSQKGLPESSDDDIRSSHSIDHEELEDKRRDSIWVPPQRSDSPALSKQPTKDRVEPSFDSVSPLNQSTDPPEKPNVRRGSTATGARGRRPSFVTYPRSLSFREKPNRPFSVQSGKSNRFSTQPMTIPPLREVLPQLTPQEKAFFDMLDAQLEKIETFYSAREKEVAGRTKLLETQLEELGDHKKLIQAAHSRGPKSWSSALINDVTDKVRRTVKSKLTPVSETTAIELKDTNDGSPDRHSKGKWKQIEDDGVTLAFKDQKGKNGIPLSADPDEYLQAKKKLKKAVLEHYRLIEMLQNYRILNITGFRKALKKFEKCTRIPLQQQYMSEKVDRSAFGSDKSLQKMMEELQLLYATRFTKGDRKRAMARLRAGYVARSHHFSVFRSGLLIGLGLPPFVWGVYSSFQPATREAIPGWQALLYIYGVLAVPVVFTALVGLNLLVWSRSRINYVFIFQLDSRSRLDHREYYEVPCLLLSALCYCFWLSFLRIADHMVDPVLWPLVWLGICFVVVVNPFHFLFKSSRYWLIKRTAALFGSGLRRVEFPDFWLGDQFCSLTFTLSNLYLFGCVYAQHYSPDWLGKCGARSVAWPVAFVLASLPLLFRLLQSIKRYCDSGLIIHLINGGKYGSGIISNIFFYVWRHQGTDHRGAIFALWCLANTLYAVYACTWDLVMDWSVLKLHSKHFLLRDELIYSDFIPLYYFAIITNFLLRFVWILYIPQGGPSLQLRLFIAAMLEMLRRVQWNFFRLENEHLGNMDQYRVSREVPLPYTVPAEDEDDGDEDIREISSVRRGLDLQRQKVAEAKRN